MRLRPFTTTAVYSLLIALGIGLARLAFMTSVAIVVIGSFSEEFRLRGASTYPTSGGSVLRFYLDPPQRSVRTSAPDLRSNLRGTDYRVDRL